MHDADVFWQGVPLGTGQAASVTFATPRTDTPGVSLKPQSNGLWGEGVVQVMYDVLNQRIQVWAYNPETGWIQKGKDIPVEIAGADQFRVLVRANGLLEFYRNGTLFAKQRIN